MQRLTEIPICQESCPTEAHKSFPGSPGVTTLHVVSALATVACFVYLER